MTDAIESEWISDSVLREFECLGLSANDDVAPVDPTDPTTKAGACVAQEELEALGTSSRNTGILGQGEGLRHGYHK